MGKFIRVQSDINIDVTPGLMYIDMTNEDAHIPDRFRVASAWIQSRISIRQGAHYYPAKIKNWGSVISLVDHGQITLGTECDEIPDAEEAKLAGDMLARLEREEAKYAERSAAAKRDQMRGAKSAQARSAKRIVKLEEEESAGE